MTDVVVLGGYGGFGQRIVRALASADAAGSAGPVPRVLVAGRRLREAEAFCAAAGLPALAPLGLDVARAEDIDRLVELRPRVVIDTAGPFQGADRRLARACIRGGAHYVDIADDPQAVHDIVQLDAEATAHDVLVVSGASTVPSLSCAVVDSLAAGFATVESIDIGISPGYDGPRGLATIRSILSYVGRPIDQWRNGRRAQAPGWSGACRHAYPHPVGLRWLSRVDVPDTRILPRRFPGLHELEIRAGLEVPLAHHALGAIAWLVGRGWLQRPERHAALARRIAAWLDGWGSDVGAMHVRVAGTAPGGTHRSRLWTVVAEAGAGPEIPGTAAVLLARRLLVPRDAPGGIQARGAMPAVGLLALPEFEREWRRHAIRTSVVEEAGAVGG